MYKKITSSIINTLHIVFMSYSWIILLSDQSISNRAHAREFHGEKVTI